MRPTPPGSAGSQNRLRRLRDGSSQSVLLGLAAFILGAAVTAFWLHHPAKTPAPGEAPVQLSESTLSVLRHLDKPVEIRFYSVLDPNAGVVLNEFSHKIEQVLSAFQQANGKVSVLFYDSATNATPNAARADGIKGFDLDKGEGSYLGVTLYCGGKKEVLAQLAPEWGSAFEADLSRAIGRVEEAGATRVSASQSAANAQATQAVKERIPNYGDVSIEDGTRLLLEASLKEFTTVVTEMQAQVQEAQKQLQQAQSGSTADQDAAMKHLQEIQSVQSQKLREIGAKSHAEVEAWKQLKAQSK
ncbi:MAG TPA: Gldg family protein [Verrucomicrobiae bacterium]|nr:Gldg family protein [Verrucomicrobiae bacterium]